MDHHLTSQGGLLTPIHFPMSSKTISEFQFPIISTGMSCKIYPFIWSCVCISCNPWSQRIPSPISSPCPQFQIPLLNFFLSHSPRHWPVVSAISSVVFASVHVLLSWLFPLRQTFSPSNSSLLTWLHCPPSVPTIPVISCRQTAHLKSEFWLWQPLLRRLAVLFP